MDVVRGAADGLVRRVGWTENRVEKRSKHSFTHRGIACSLEEILRLFVVNEFRRCGLTGSNILIRARVVGRKRGIIIRRNIDDCFREKRGLAVHRRILG